MPIRSSTVGRILLEAASVAVAGAAFAFAANELSPRGLDLARNYFPSGAGSSVARPNASAPAPVTTATNENSAAAEIDQRVRDKGLQPLDRLQTERLFHDPRYDDGLIVFVDARGEDDYHDGHIPGAYELDPFHPDKDMANVLAPCQIAVQVVVYCTGGDCEDADSAALLLRDAGISREKLFVYGGGFTDWTDHHLPVARGERNSPAAPAQTK